MTCITILTVGSRGDIQPLCAIALGLMKRGHQVTLAGSPNFSDFAAQLKIPFASIPGDFKQILSSPEGIALLEGDREAKIIDEKLLWQQMEAAWKICQGSELILFSPLTGWGYHLAEALNIPAILATQLPISPTKVFSFLNFANRTDRPLTGLANLLSYYLFSFVLWRRDAKTINRFRKDVLNLPQLPFCGAQYRRNPPPLLSPLPIVNCYSAAVIPPPKDWPDSVYQASYCFLNTALNKEHYFTPSQKLQDFLEQEPKPFYVGFGSMIPRHPERLAQTIVSALTATGQRAVLCSGWGNVTQKDLPPSVYLLDSVPHEWLFPKTVGAIHHGGAGTSAATLNAGIPSVVVPFFADQPAWGAQLKQLGVSPATLPQSELTQNSLAKNIRRILEEDSFQKRAKEIQSQLQAENGVARVVSIIESCARSH